MSLLKETGDDGAHRGIQIDRDIDEKQFIEMFKNGGKLTTDTTKSLRQCRDYAPS